MRDRRDGRPFAPGLTAGAPHRRALARLAALAVCVPLLGGWTKGSGVEIVSRYYSKHGADHAELVASVRRNGPKGGQAYGIGYIDFFPRYRTAFVAGVCRIDEAEVGLRSSWSISGEHWIVLFPRWRGDPPGGRRGSYR